MHHVDLRTRVISITFLRYASYASWKLGIAIRKLEAWHYYICKLEACTTIDPNGVIL